MVNPSIGFVGGGRVARILLGGWERTGVSLPKVVVCEHDDQAIGALQTASQSVSPVRGEAASAGSQELVFLAVHPPKLAEAASQIAGTLREGAIVVSLAPKVTLVKLKDLLGGFDRLLRIMPNAPSLIGHGFNPVCWGDSLGERDRRAVRSLMEPLGELPEVAEETLEAYAILSAMGPTYFWPQWLELQSLAEEFGLDAESAQQGLRAMTAGALHTWCESGLSPEELLDLIPVKPLADFEPTLQEAYRSRLTALMAKIRP